MLSNLFQSIKIVPLNVFKCFSFIYLLLFTHYLFVLIFPFRFSVSSSILPKLSRRRKSSSPPYCPPSKSPLISDLSSTTPPTSPSKSAHLSTGSLNSPPRLNDKNSATAAKLFQNPVMPNVTSAMELCSVVTDGWGAWGTWGWSGWYPLMTIIREGDDDEFLKSLEKDCSENADVETKKQIEVKNGEVKNDGDDEKMKYDESIKEKDESASDKTSETTTDEEGASSLKEITKRKGTNSSTSGGYSETESSTSHTPKIKTTPKKRNAFAYQSTLIRQRGERLKKRIEQFARCYGESLIGKGEASAYVLSEILKRWIYADVFLFFIFIFIFMLLPYLIKYSLSFIVHSSI